jgi:hypothetical protein
MRMLLSRTPEHAVLMDGGGPIGLSSAFAMLLLHVLLPRRDSVAQPD